MFEEIIREMPLMKELSQQQLITLYRFGTYALLHTSSFRTYPAAIMKLARALDVLPISY